MNQAVVLRSMRDSADTDSQCGKIARIVLAVAFDATAFLMTGGASDKGSDALDLGTSPKPF